MTKPATGFFFKKPTNIYGKPRTFGVFSENWGKFYSMFGPIFFLRSFPFGTLNATIMMGNLEATIDVASITYEVS
jgi:hypothetical protein